jgi:hypothetical protein
MFICSGDEAPLQVGIDTGKRLGRSPAEQELRRRLTHPRVKQKRMGIRMHQPLNPKERDEGYA